MPRVTTPQAPRAFRSHPIAWGKDQPRIDPFPGAVAWRANDIQDGAFPRMGNRPPATPAICLAEDVQQFVQRAVQTEMAKDRDDHSRWIYFEIDRREGYSVKQWVAETLDGSLRRVIEMNGQPVPEPEQRRKMDAYLRDPSARSKTRKSEQHDDQQATEMLNLLPQAFIWTNQGTKGNLTLLHFKPNPNFKPPDLEARVFAAMEGDMAVDTNQLRIASLKGRLIHDVKIFGGFFGNLDAGGTFDVERRETGHQIWQITETHVHIRAMP